MEESVEGEQMQENGAQKPSCLENGHTIEESLQEQVENEEADFNTWTSLISNIEKTSHRCVESVCEVYDAFLLEFPLCHGYWKKYASYVACYCTLNEVENVYKRGVEAIPYCVDLWASYCSFGMLAYEDPADVRRLFDRGLSFVGKDYSSYLLWDKYIEFEHSQKQWSRLAYVYINALRFPTKKINDYYMSFKKLVAIGEEEMGCEKSISVDTGADREEACRKVCEQAEIRNVIRSLMTIQDGIPSPSIVKKYLSIGELLYHSSSQMVEKIKFYEDRIQRPYFHLKPLDECQLENWHQYLDFVEKQGDFDWTVKLYERCLIPCANYSELWIRYVEFVEAKGGREIANNALTRAQKVFLKRMPAFHLYCSMFKEKIGDVDGARASFQSHRKLDPKFVENVYREANMEKRMGNAESACMVYEKAVEVAQGKQNLGILSLLYVKFAHFKFVVSNDIYAPIEVFMRGIQEVPCKYLIQEMINFIALRGGPEQIPKLDSLIADIMVPESAVSEALNFSDREEISSLFLEVVDLHGTIDEVRKAWNRHRKFFPHIMKHVVECHSTQIRDSPLARAVMGTKHIFDSNQTCGDDGHDNSRMHLLYYHSHEDDHSPPKSMEACKLPDSVIRNKGIEELVVPEDVEKQSINDNKGMEELVEAAENVDEQSIPEGIDEHVEVVVDEEKQHTNDEKEGEDLVEVAEDVKKKTIPGGTDELHEVVGESAHECQAAAQVPETTPESGDSLRIHVLENLSITSPQNETEQSNPPASCDHNIPNEGKPGEISSIHVSAPLDTKSSALSQDQIHKSLLHSVCESTPTGSQSNPPVEMQVHEHTTQQQAVTVSAAYSQNAGSVFNLPQMHYVQPSQSQQWQGHPQFQYPPAGTTSTQMVVTQGYPCQSQASQMASAQVYQSVQEQNYAYIQLQSSTQPLTQSQLNPQSIISNEQQYGCSQNSQGIPPHILQYYQQKYYYLQQDNQQVQNVQQYQQLLYMQQQQQHQLYQQQQQQQQHQLYQQQQQQYYIQQQQFQQLTQQEQQLLLQQHQQQFPQQMQQQYLLLQQQHQQQLQQLQQLQQQSTQQHQQPPVQQQQQQINGSDRKALSSPNVQGEGDNLQSAEKVWAFESSASSSKSMIV